MRSRNFAFCVRIIVGLWSLPALCYAASLTIYNDNFAVVRESLPLTLKAGINEVSVNNITARLEPDSVILRDPQGRRALQILEQNYRADRVSEGLLLSLYEGQTIEFLTEDDRIVQGRIIRSGYTPLPWDETDLYFLDEEILAAAHRASQPLIEVEGRIRFGLPGKPLFPTLTDDTVLKPTLHWRLHADQEGSVDAELSYVTGDMRWKADYNLLTTDDRETTEVIGWITLYNESGRTFDDARVKLMAGDVSKMQTGSGAARRGLGGGLGGGGMGEPPVTERTFEDYHLYTLTRTATLRDRETKQVEFLRATGVRSKRLYVYNGTKIGSGFRYSETNRRNRGYGTEFGNKVSIFKEFLNSQDNGLGVPLPAGTVRFYRQDEDRQLEFTGENRIDHTPKDETVRLYTGNAFDLVGERRQIHYSIDTDANSLEESFEIKVRNRKEQESVEVRIVEHLYRWSTWQIQEASQDYEKKDSRTIEFKIDVPPGQERMVTYDAHYTW